MQIALVYCGKGRTWTEKELSYFDLFDSLLMLDIPERIDDGWESNVFSTLDKLEKGMKSKKMVFVSLPYSRLPSPANDDQTIKPFRQTFPPVLDRFEEMKGFIEKVRTDFSLKKYKSLDLFGMYWNNETYWYDDDHFELLLMSLLSLYLKDKTLKFLWIPASSRVGVDKRNREMAVKIKNLGIFDYVVLQPNYYQERYGRNIDDLKGVNELCKKEGLGIQIEFGKEIFREEGHQKRALDYFTVVDNDLLAYYMDDKAFVMGANFNHPVFQKVKEKIEKSRRE